MNFSQPMKYSGIVVYSPNCKYFAITKDNELIVIHYIYYRYY